ncbi:hypothetical protein MA16_Dca010879 [Dendrobium catenatum]|uniref:Protein SPEAR1 n=1 Tax=Dendrobium catenatum TaxID=906689 RepID=A0A2I0X7B2_9ASPA|nr:hypothetical protein MA16_Dca010879 [Dendrobium catenatum]
MGSNQHGEFGLGSGRSSSSSRRGKKTSSEKPKKPQRGLGVAQLEKIRIQSQLMDNYNMQTLHPSFHSNLIMEENMRQTLNFPSSPPSSSFSSSSSSAFGIHPNLSVLYEETGSADYRFGDPYSCTSARFLPPDSISNHSYPNHLRSVALPLFEDSVEKRIRPNNCYSAASYSHISDSSDSQELDLELRLSLK